MITLPADDAVGQTRYQRALLLTTLTASVFLSAALLFAVQPMFTKMVLPRFGGAPQVWSVAMVFFQAALLAGYGYAHLLTRYAPGRTSILIQIALLVVASLTLPLSVAAGGGLPPAVGEAFRLLGLFTVSIGLPLFALSANAPLLQAWFARTSHPSAHDPYFLYAASNVGSFAALIAYPIAIEPLITLTDQRRFWSMGFYALILVIAASSWLLSRAGGGQAVAAADETSDVSAPTRREAAVWTALAAVPAGLLLAVTAHISTDIGAAPLLWVLPLALYLLTFVIVFSRRPIIPHRFVVAIQPFFALALVAVIFLEPYFRKTILLPIGFNLVVFFICALMCHGELARRRPAAQHLTAFYMWMSAGGMIGGISAGLLAPYVFNWIAEYPILIVLAVLCRPGLGLPKAPLERVFLFGAVALGTAILIAVPLLHLEISEKLFNFAFVALLFVSVLFWRDPLPFAAIIAFVLIANHEIVDVAGARTVRSFFGVYKISESEDGRFRLLSHGTTLHGGQRIRDDAGQPITGRPEPILYYFVGSALAQVLDAARSKTAPIRYAVIGLGTGNLACQGQPGDTAHFFEIDPAVVRISTDPESFSSLSECGPVSITIGDARLTLAEAPDQSYDAIVVDAFSSDAIPIHLLTREAMATYRKKLAPHGIIGVHVSNRHLELASVVGGIAEANHMVARVNDGTAVPTNYTDYIYSASVVAVARAEDDLGPLVHSEYWQVVQVDPKQWVWTDDYCDLVGAILRKLKQ